MASDDGPAMTRVEEIETLARSLIRAEQTNLGVEMATQVVYPNGDLVTVIVASEGTSFFVNDASFGMMYLSRLGIKLTAQQLNRARSEIAHYSCNLKDGRIFRRSTLDTLPDSIALVANASRTLADYGVEARRLTDNDFRLSVIERLREVIGGRVREREPLEGASGRSYRVGGVVLDRGETRPVAFVEAFSGRNTVGDRFTEFFDLRQKYTNVSMVTVYDDSQRWNGGDIKLLSEVSKVVRFSNSKRDFEELASQ